MCDLMIAMWLLLLLLVRFPLALHLLRCYSIRPKLDHLKHINPIWDGSVLLLLQKKELHAVADSFRSKFHLIDKDKHDEHTEWVNKC